MTADPTADPVRPPVDHRAEAEKRLRWAASNERAKWAMVNATIAQAHATLAGPATRTLEIHHRHPEYDELREAAREALATVPVRVRELEHPAIARLRELLR